MGAGSRNKPHSQSVKIAIQLILIIPRNDTDATLRIQCKRQWREKKNNKPFCMCRCVIVEFLQPGIRSCINFVIHHHYGHGTHTSFDKKLLFCFVGTIFAES